MKIDSWTLTVKCTVFAGDMSKQNVIDNAQEILERLTDGSDIISIAVEEAKRDEI